MKFIYINNNFIITRFKFNNVLVLKLIRITNRKNLFKVIMPRLLYFAKFSIVIFIYFFYLLFFNKF